MPTTGCVVQGHSSETVQRVTDCELGMFQESCANLGTTPAQCCKPWRPMKPWQTSIGTYRLYPLDGTYRLSIHWPQNTADADQKCPTRKMKRPLQLPKCQTGEVRHFMILVILCYIRGFFDAFNYCVGIVLLFLLLPLEPKKSPGIALCRASSSCPAAAAWCRAVWPSQSTALADVKSP